MNISNYNLKIRYADIFLLSSLFPFVNLNLTSFDTQPLTFLLGLLGISLSFFSFHVNKIFRISFILVLIALFISSFTVNGSSYFVIRGIYNYLSLFLFLFIFAFLYKNKLVNNHLIVAANYIYIFAGFLQIYFPSIITFFIKARGLNAIKTFNYGRGLSSLTPEPTHFGVVLFLLSILLLINSGYKFKENIFLHSINFLSLFILVRSASLIMILLFSLLIILILNLNQIFKSKNLKILSTLFFSITIGIFYSIKSETRIYKIFQVIKGDSFMETLMIIVNIDKSISERLQHLVIPFVAFFRDFGIPHAFNGLEDYLKLLSNDLVFFNEATTSQKFMSFIGDYVFSLGIFGVIAALLIFIPLFIKSNVPNYILIIFLSLLITSVPISMPLVPAVIAGFYYGNENIKYKRKFMTKIF